jgi:hypothetical protein
MTESNWQQVGVVYDGTLSNANRVKIFKNGKPIACTVTGTIPNVFTAGTANLKLGRGDDTGFSSFVGLADELKIYNFALTADQIAIDTNANAALNFSTGTAASESSTLTDGVGAPPIGYWNFDENSGTTVNDKSGNGLSLAGSPFPQWTSGKVGAGLIFNVNGGNSVVGVIDNSLLEPQNDMTVETWFRFKQLPSVQAKSAILVDKIHSVSPFNAYFIDISTSDQIRFSWRNTTPTAYTATTTTNAINPNIWYHLAVEKNGTSLAIYVNGRNVTNASDTTTGTLYNSNGEFRIGTDSVSNNRAEVAIDETQLFTYARTQAQIAYDYNRGRPIGWWRFDECQGLTINDDSGNLNHGTITIGGGGTQSAVGTCTTAGTAWGNGSTGKFNGSLNFDGSDDYVVVTDPGTNSILDQPDSFTTSVWFKPNTLTGNDKFLLSKGDASVNNIYMAYALVGGDFGYSPNQLVCGYYNGAVATEARYPINLSTGQWYHITCVMDDPNNTLKLYLDGKLVNTNAGATVDPSTTVNDGQIRIARERDALTYYPDGQIDDVRMYNYPLSLSQIQQLYNGDAAVRFGPAQGSP